ncbi:hypothetical protein MMYC01_208506 [Madurella mycetomatis]|uniref:Rhodopsin domain-containing protein n=1 Tax=Madurella mycetomatis TaxID=100816 RepID=A0A175VTU0_9PEZI|nr:hypothetical protein MMYC01_208506 [Madurella mycetomatis]
MSFPSGLDFCTIPAQMPPDGQIPDYDDWSSLPPVIIAVCAVMMSSAAFITAGRLFANKRQLAWSDFIARSIFMTTALCSAKASIFMLLSQIFTIQRHMKLAIWAGLIATTLLYLMNIIFIFYYFTPSPGQTWDDVVLTAKVDGSLVWTVASSVLNLVLNLYIFFLPLPIVARLSWPLEKRLKVAALFSTAFLIFNMTDSSDRTWKVASMMLCILVEMHITIIVGSVPGFSKFLRVHASNWAPVKTLRSQLYGSGRAALNGPGSGSSNPRNKPRTGRGDGPAQHRYFELNDSWLMKSNATVQVRAIDSLGMQPSTAVGIVRTVDVEQASSELPPEDVAVMHGHELCGRGYSQPTGTNMSATANSER